MASFRTGYEGLAGAVTSAFDTYWRRKEGQKGRDAQLERLQKQLDAAKAEGNTQREADLQKQIQDRLFVTSERVAGETADIELKKIPSIVEHRGQTPESARFEGITEAITTDVNALKSMVDNFETWKKFYDESGIQQFDPDILTEDQFNYIKQNTKVKQDYLRKQITDHRVNIITMDAERTAAEEYFNRIGWTNPVDWSGIEAYIEDDKETGEGIKKDIAEIEPFDHKAFMELIGVYGRPAVEETWDFLNRSGKKVVADTKSLVDALKKAFPNVQYPEAQAAPPPELGRPFADIPKLTPFPEATFPMGPR